MDMKLKVAEYIAQAAQQSFENCALTGNDVSAMIETPPDKKMGDYALPCFRLSKTMRCAPQMIAGKLAEKIACEEIDHVEVVGANLNVFLRRRGQARDIQEAVLKNPGRRGSSEIGKGKTVCLDYSSINIAKRFHIGHLSTTMIGNSLKRIYDFNGYTTVGINHLGDWGTQFGKMICAYKKWGNREEVEKGGVQAMVDLYVRFHHEAEQHPELEDEGRAWFKKIEDGDQEAMEIFTWFKEVTLKDTQRVYDLLGVSFDSYAGESFYNDKMAPVVEELREKGLLIESQGAQVVDLEAYGMPPALILRSDGATLYITRDLAAAFYRHNTYHFDKCLYVVAYQQNLHFAQWFKVVELMGYDWYDRLVHVPYGTVSIDGAKLATRTGNVVLLKDLFATAIEKARAIIEEKNPTLENKDEVAKQVGVGAIVFHYLSNSRIKDINFVMEDALSFDGNTGPYAQYTYARTRSILRRAGAAPTGGAIKVTSPEEGELAKVLTRFPERVAAAIAEYEPSDITRYILDLCAAFNRFYHECPILSAEDADVRDTRISLVSATSDVLGNALDLICMGKPEQI